MEDPAGSLDIAIGVAGDLHVFELACTALTVRIPQIQQACPLVPLNPHLAEASCRSEWVMRVVLGSGRWCSANGVSRVVNMVLGARVGSSGAGCTDEARAGQSTPSH